MVVSVRRLVILVVPTFLLFAAAWAVTAGVQLYAGRRRPTVVYAPPRPAEPDADPQVTALRKRVTDDPGDAAAWKELGLRLAGRARSASASQGDLEEAVDALLEASSRLPDDTTVILALGDLSFDKRAFQIAATYYERYLAADPGSLGVRARYGSVLTFLGRSGQSIAELEKVLAVKPDDFQARAYLSVAHEQAKEYARALEEGRRAVDVAPNDEARARMKSFLATVERRAAAGGDAPARREPPVDTLAPLEAVVSSHQIAGPRFVDARRDGAAAVLRFRDFPVSAMPPFARDTFFAKLWPAVPEDVRTLVFVDAGSGAETFRVGR